VLGRALIGAGHALGMLISLTVILLHRDEYNLSFSLGAYDMDTTRSISERPSSKESSSRALNVKGRRRPR
jgi:hypothetical protein